MLIDDEEEEVSEIKLSKDLINSSSNNKNTNNQNSIKNDFGFTKGSNNTNNNNNFFDPFSTNNGELNIDNNQNVSKDGTGLNTISGLDSIFGGGNTNTNIFGGNNNIGGGLGFDIFDLSGGSKNQNSQNINSNMNLGLFGGTGTTNSNSNSNQIGGGLDFMGFSNQINTTPTTNINTKEKLVFTNSDLKLNCTIVKNSPSDLSINYLASNLTSLSLTSFKLTISATNYLSVKLLPSSSITTLDPNQQNGITKEIAVTNNDLSKAVKLKIKISYFKSGVEITDSVVQSDFN